MNLLARHFFHLALLGLNVGFVVVCFRWIPEKKIAATAAGLSFILTSGALVLRTCRNLPGKPLTPWVCGAFLILVAIPMVALRLLNWSVEFSDLIIWGIPGPEFHRMSSKAFLLQPIAVIVDAARARLRRGV